MIQINFKSFQFSYCASLSFLLKVVALINKRNLSRTILAGEVHTHTCVHLVRVCTTISL